MEAGEGGRQVTGGGDQAISEKILVDRIRKSDRWMITLTPAIAVTSIVSAVIFGKQLIVMSGQLDEMRSSSKQTDQTIAALKALPI